MFVRFLLFITLLISSAWAPTTFAVPQPREEFITPAEPVSSLRSRVIPCYSGYRGVGRSAAGVEVAGEECPPYTSSLPRRYDRPEQGGEVDTPGNPFPKRME
ncbi:hypothetical protein D3C87_1632090 [compost metagenome]